MPELPEVETTRKGLESLLKGSTIKQVAVYWERIISPTMSIFQFCNELVGEVFETFERRGKYLIIRFQRYGAIIHLRMEGKFEILEKEEELSKHTHIVFELTDERKVCYVDVRKFGRISLYPIEQLDTQIQTLPIGPEPFLDSFQLELFQQKLKQHHVRIKPLLLQQKVVAGIGNIYADEILFRSKIYPATYCDELTEQQIATLHTEIIAVMTQAIAAGGSTIRTYQNALGAPGHFQKYLQVYGRTGMPCVNCAESIKKIKLAGRGTHFCPTCQLNEERIV